MIFILVHGLGHGGWCWEQTKQELELRGHRVAAPDLPLTSLVDDADCVARLVDQQSTSADGEAGKVVLVGHSYGGLVISAAAARAKKPVDHLVYLAAAMIGSNDDYFALLAEHGTELSANLIESDGTWLTVSQEKAAQGFYGACDEATIQRAVALLRPTSLNCWNLITPIPEPWLQIRSLYIVCSQDEAMPPGMQRVLAGNATETAELDTDHSPFFSANSELCDLLVGRTEAVSVAAG